MAYGLILYNNDNQLTLTDQGRVFGYIGKASLNGIVQPDTRLEEGVYYETGGYSVYSIYWPGDIIPVITITSDGGIKLVDYLRSGDYWFITVHKLANSIGNIVGAGTQGQAEVHVFGAPVNNTTAGLWGIAIYNDSNTLVGDLSRRPLSFVKLANLYGDSNIDVSGIIKPGIVGNNISAMSATLSGGGGTRELWSSFIKSGSTITTQFYVASSLSTTGPGGTGTPTYTNVPYNSSVMVIELNGL